MRIKRRFFGLEILLAASSCASLSAADFTWNGGDGLWDTTALNWNAGASAWVNDTGNNAFLNSSGTSNTLTLSGAIVAGTITASNNASSPYLINGAGGDSLSATSLLVQGVGSLTLAADITAGSTTVSSGTLQIGNGGTTGSLAGNMTDNSTLVFNRSDASTYAGSISGTGNVVKLGAGTLTLSGSSSQTGTFTVSSGTVVAANDHALGADHQFNSIYKISVSGSTAGLVINQGVNISNIINVENNGTIYNQGTITGVYPIFTNNGGMTVVNTGTLIGTTGEDIPNAVSAQGTSQNFLTNTGGLITAPGGVGVSFTSGGSVINQSGGRIQADNGTAVNITSGTLQTLVNTGSSSIIGDQGVYFAAGNLTNSNGSVISGTSFNGVTIDPGSVLVQSSTLTNTGTSSIFGEEYGAYITNDSISSVHSTVINSAGSIIQSSTNSDGVAGVYMTGAGGTIRNSGSSTIRGRNYGVYVSSDSFIPVVTVVSNTGGSLIQSSTSAGGIAGVFVTNYTAAVTNDATSTIIGRQWGVRLANGGSVINQGVITGSLASSATNAGVSFAGAAGTLTNSGTINGGVIMGNFANTVTLNIGSVINGNLNVGTGTTARLILDGATGTQVSSAAVTGTFAFSGTIIKQGAGTWVLDQTFSSTRGITISAGTLQVGNSGTTGSIAAPVANSGTLAFKRTDNYSFGKVISGTGMVRQIGSGTTTLSGTNTYSGGTVITDGAIFITDVGAAASVLGSGTLDVQQNGKLGGVGTVRGNTTVEGTLAPGTAVGTIQFSGSVLLASSATVAMDLSSLASFDRITTTGLLTYDGTLSISLLGGYRPIVGNTFDLFDPGSFAAGSSFDTIIFDVAGYAGSMDYTTGILTVTAVPEPAMVALLALGGLGLIARQRQKLFRPVR